MQHTTATHCCNTLLQHTNVPTMSSLLWYYCNTLPQHTTATHYCHTLLQHTNMPTMSFLLWYSNMSGPWTSKPRFWSLRSQTEPFFTTRVENRTLPIIWEFLWNRSDADNRHSQWNDTNHFLSIPLRITIPICNEETRGSDWKIKSKNN